ncbi:hypothetical protein BFO_1022 [Tannerella forsythia 92A2]|uniref:Uncharacterized protein n=1 Tax=Tannerella forsythia (strain ATCC 43037 / JCM 10827 / CCUG 21028 A / KCTC 5666 / FDC 338) TaxID=203275 RepID=G8UQM4_TANFA|nr:hypothetical protein BFO_1022 [Tannerella forsythia 92A2]
MSKLNSLSCFSYKNVLKSFQRKCVYFIRANKLFFFVIIYKIYTRRQ